MGVNYTNVFTYSFYACRSQKRKELLELTVFFSLLGSVGVKAARKHVGEIDTSSVFQRCLRFVYCVCVLCLILSFSHFFSLDIFYLGCKDNVLEYEKLFLNQNISTIKPLT